MSCQFSSLPPPLLFSIPRGLWEAHYVFDALSLCQSAMEKGKGSESSEEERRDDAEGAPVYDCCAQPLRSSTNRGVDAAAAAAQHGPASVPVDMGTPAWAQQQQPAAYPGFVSLDGMASSLPLSGSAQQGAGSALQQPQAAAYGIPSYWPPLLPSCCSSRRSCVLDGTAHPPETPDEHYTQLRSYVEGGDLVQIGIVFTDNVFNVISGKAYQLNLKFDPNWRSPDHPGVAFLKRKGIFLEDHATRGVAPEDLARLLLEDCGLLCNKELQWVTFMGGNDIGFLVRLLSGRHHLPHSRGEFLELVAHYFPCCLDCKFYSAYSGGITAPVPGRLEEVGQELGVVRTGRGHQAASDALLTLRCLDRLRARKPSFMKTARGALYGVGFANAMD
ncbi:hypothetical protein BS78_10G059000 [Paspalum vaginatum]|nr:hypothetical protein BS78_10G059000 [Paspalum vaginatum]